MTTPTPRPPGPWRALARDGVLNPEEAAARDAVIAACMAPAPPQPAFQPAPEDDPVALTPERRLSPYQSLVDRTGGWKLRMACDDERARLEAFHPGGAAVMVTAVRGRRINAYVLPAAKKKTPRWRVIHPTDLEAFLTRQQVIAPHTPTSLCACGKRQYPTEARAKDAIVDVTILRVVKRHGLQGERRAYRCPDDARVWHLTSRETWDDEPKPKREKKRQQEHA